MSKTTTIAEILAIQPSDKSWVNDSFKAVVRNASSPRGKGPGRALLSDPENPNTTIEGVFWGTDPCRYEGMIVLIGGKGLKRGADQKTGAANVSISEKATVNTFQNTASNNGEVGLHRPAAPTPVMANVDFAGEMAKIQGLYLYSIKKAIETREMAKLSLGLDMTADQFQACTSAIFIEANRKGLASFLPTSTNTPSA